MLNTNTAVLISIRPNWCELIASGKKTIEVRKTKPKIQTPFKCYIYCTLSGSNNFFHTTLKSDIAKWNTGNWGNRKGKVIGEFVCDCIEYFNYGIQTPEEATNYLDCYEGYPEQSRLEEDSQLTIGELLKYGNKKGLYAWHISELVIYDKPKGLSEFMTLGALSFEELQEDVCNYCRPTRRGEIKISHGPNGVYMCEGRFCDDAYKTYLEEEFSLKRPPQSWCYVEEVSA